MVGVIVPVLLLYNPSVCIPAKCDIVPLLVPEN